MSTEASILSRKILANGVIVIKQPADTLDTDLPESTQARERAAPVVQVTDLVKRYGDFVAVDGVSFAIQPGETYGLLGPNGAGKTSIMRMLCALSPVSAGSAEVAGFDVVRASRDVRTALGVVTQEDGLDPDLDALGNLRIHGYLAGLSWQAAQARAREVLGFFELAERAHAEIDELSGGMRRRLAIARALMLSPPVIVLDEPSTGLDPHSRHQVWDRLAALKARGVTVLMSTHYMEEAAALCDRVAIMDRGRILDEGAPAALIERHARAQIADQAPTLEDVYLLLTGRTLQEE